MKDTGVIAVVGIVCETLIAVVAMWKGVDTTIIVSVAGSIGTAIGAILGYEYGVKKTA